MTLQMRWFFMIINLEKEKLQIIDFYQMLDFFSSVNPEADFLLLASH